MRRPVHRRRLGLVAALVLVVTACSGGGSTSTTATTAPLPTSGPTADAPRPTATSGALDEINISDLLGGTTSVPPTTWVRVSDAQAPFSFDVPSTWTTHAAYPWQQGGATIGTALAAGVDLSKLSVDFSVPGIVLGVSANAAGMTARQVVEGDTGFDSVCSASPIQEASEGGASVAYQLWTSCGGSGVLLVLAIAAAGQGGLIGIVFQGSSEADLGYLDHIVASLAATGAPATSAPAASGGASVSGPTYTISLEFCQNQHGQGVSGGLIRNDDPSLIHTYRIVVAFSDPNGVFLNDTGWTTSDLQPGVTARWQADVPSGLPAVSVSCRITSVEVVR